MYETRKIVSCCALLVASALSSTASARVEAISEYSKAQTFSGALRYLRVELGYEVVEKDDAAAYLLFRYPAPARKDTMAQGSIEVIEASGSVKLFIQLPQSPEYQERLVRDGLLRKLRQEYGAPPAKPPVKKPVPDASKPSAPKPD